MMYPDLFRGLSLKSEDLSKYNTPLVGFDGQMVILEGQISLPVNMEGKEVMVTIIVVTLFSPYTAILGRGNQQGMVVVRGNQQVARQGLVATVNREIKQKEPAPSTLIATTRTPKGNGGQTMSRT